MTTLAPPVKPVVRKEDRLTPEISPRSSGHHGVLERERQIALDFPPATPPISYRTWQSGSGPAVRGILLFHRGHEHSARLRELATTLAAADPGTLVIAWDAPSADLVPVADHPALIDEFVTRIASLHGLPLSDLAVVAHSISAVTVTAWVQDFAPPLRALVLATPAFEIKLYVPFAWQGLALLRRLRPTATVKGFVKGRHLTRDPEQASAYDRDPQIDPGIPVASLLELRKQSRRVLKNAHALHVPTLVLTAGNDAVVKEAPQDLFNDGLQEPLSHRIVYPGARHDLFHEVNRKDIFSDVGAFLARRFLRPPGSGHSPLASSVAAAEEKYGPLTNPRTPWIFRVQRLGLNSLGRLSDGVRLGWKTGFDSGPSLDYVYRNKASGFSPLGRAIDHFYLNSPGWRGIRTRRENLCSILKETIRDVHASKGGPVHVLDVACGGGRYVLETVRELSQGEESIPVTAELRDFVDTSLDRARAVAMELGLDASVTIAHSDAFDGDGLRAIRPRPDIAIVSGLYELFRDNELLERSLKAIADLLPAGGRLIYTNQPWHPQLEMIARVLPNRDGNPWVMRPRSQWEMDSLVKNAGFEKVQTRTDREGIFSVSLAQKAG